MSPGPVQKQTAHGKEATKHVLFSDEDTDFLIVWRLDKRPPGLERYLVRPRTRQGIGSLLEAVVLPHGAPKRARLLLESEVELASRLSHPAIARVYGLHEAGGRAFLLTEHVEGCSLDTLLNFCALRGRQMTEAFSLHVTSILAGALHIAHNLKDEQGQPLGLIHRAVHPGCIRLGRKGEVKLTDFASAYSLLPRRPRTPPGLLRGELEYAAPERFQPPGTAREDARSDLFSLGLVLQELLTGQWLYTLHAVEQALRRSGPAPGYLAGWTEEAPSWGPPSELARRVAVLHAQHVEDTLRQVSAPVKAIVHKALRGDPAERYPTAARMQADLLRCLRAVRGQPYSSLEAERELFFAWGEAEASPLREAAFLGERGVFAGDVPEGSCGVASPV